MEALRRAALDRPLGRQRRVAAFLDKVGDDGDDPAVVAVLYQIVHGVPRPPPNVRRALVARSERIGAHVHHVLSRWTPTQLTGACWLSARGTSRASSTSATPDAPLRALMRTCRENGWRHMAHPPVFVAPSTHYGTPIGDGLFSLVPLLQGQLLCQFTGTVHPPSKTFWKRGARLQYGLAAQHGAHRFLVDPLDERTGSTTVHPTHVAALINEPSPPPVTVGTFATHGPTGRKGRVARHDAKTGLYEVEFAHGPDELVFPDDLVDGDATQHSFRANCVWVDFPAPLALYRHARTRPDGMHVYVLPRQRTQECTVVYRVGELSAVFDGVVNEARGRHALVPADVADGDVLTLRAGVLTALRRQALVFIRDHATVVVQHILDEEHWWRLPERVMAGTLTPCGRCTEDGDCAHCVRVAFPTVHTCADVAPGEELLCLYDTSRLVKRRGLPCLDDSQMGAEWDRVCTNAWRE